MALHKERTEEWQQRFFNMMDQIDKDYLRKLQGDMHRCAANCCDNKNYSTKRNLSCIENCGTSAENAQRYIQYEITRTQTQLGRCYAECEDAAQDALNANPSQRSSSWLNDEIDKCARKCLDKLFDTLPIIDARIRRVLESGEYNK